DARARGAPQGAGVDAYTGGRRRILANPRSDRHRGLARAAARGLSRGARPARAADQAAFRAAVRPRALDGCGARMIGLRRDPQFRSSPRKRGPSPLAPALGPWIPAFAGMSGL